MRGLNTGDGRAVFEKSIETVARLLRNRDASRAGLTHKLADLAPPEFFSLLSDQAPITKQEHANFLGYDPMTGV